MTEVLLSDTERAEFEELKRQRRDGDVVRIRWSILWQLIGYALGAFVLYNVLTNRMTAIEVQAKADREVTNSLKADLAEVKTDIKTLLRRTP